MGSPVKKMIEEPKTKQALKLVKEQNAKIEAGKKDVENLRNSVNKVDGAL
jgi:hypothetical protein